MFPLFRAADPKCHPPGIVTRARPKLEDARAVRLLADRSVCWVPHACEALGTVVKNCVERHGSNRPTTEHVLSLLREIQRVYRSAAAVSTQH